ncbi:MAG: homocysteine S-methyltransferase family protein [Alphaproteobacteria bacterium]|nr:homocysteine S-methyltransferase family protein [Alphaproteobacteria bacterium]
MPYQRLKKRLDLGEIIILDGATGTELERRGAPMDPKAWCGPATMQHHGLLTEIHADYIRAGAQVITANTFATSRVMLKAAGIGDRSVEISRRAVEAALKAREATPGGAEVVVAGSLSHMVPVAAGNSATDPTSIPSDDELAAAFGELAATLKAAGCDMIILEMMYNPSRTPLALCAALETGLPVWFGMSARRRPSGQVMSFDHLGAYALDQIAGLIPATGIDVAGVMHTGAEIMGEALAAVRRRFVGPLMAYPDSGYFEMPNWRFVDVISPERLERFFGAWLQAGARAIGGCCGLTPDHIGAAVRARAAFQGTRR